MNSVGVAKQNLMVVLRNDVESGKAWSTVMGADLLVVLEELEKTQAKLDAIGKAVKGYRTDVADLDAYDIGVDGLLVVEAIEAVLEEERG